MSSIGRTGWDWIQTRIGQVVLFWGVLELILRALDALTKSDLLLMLRKSLAPEFKFLADPQAALVLLALAFALLWGSNRPPKLAKSILNQADQPERENYSFVEATAIPFFLAFVCGVGLAAFESASPNHGQLARLTMPVPALNLSGALRRPTRVDARTLGVDPSGGTTVQQGSPQRAEPLAQSLPALTAAIDQQSERGDIAGNESRVTVSPGDLRALVMSGIAQREQSVRHSGQSISTVDAAQTRAPDAIERAHQEKNWPLLANLCESAIRENPQRLATYLLAGEAYANLGRVDRAINRLEYVKKNGASNPEDHLAVEQATELRESIRRLYGR